MTTIIYDMANVFRDKLISFSDKLAPHVARELLQVFKETEDVIIALYSARYIAWREDAIQSLNEIDDFLVDVMTMTPDAARAT